MQIFISVKVVTRGWGAEGIIMHRWALGLFDFEHYEKNVQNMRMQYFSRFPYTPWCQEDKVWKVSKPLDWLSPISLPWVIISKTIYSCSICVLSTRTWKFLLHSYIPIDCHICVRSQDPFYCQLGFFPGNLSCHHLKHYRLLSKEVWLWYKYNWDLWEIVFIS
jgi:hypothetical protein